MTNTERNRAAASDEAQVGVGHPLQLFAGRDDADASSRNSDILEDQIRYFLADIFFLGDDPASIPTSKSLIEAGILDSTGVVELIGFLEEQFGIRIEDDELMPENLDSIENIVRFVTRKRAS